MFRTKRRRDKERNGGTGSGVGEREGRGGGVVMGFLAPHSDMGVGPRMRRRMRRQEEKKLIGGVQRQTEGWKDEQKERHKGGSEESSQEERLPSRHAGRQAGRERDGGTVGAQDIIRLDQRSYYPFASISSPSLETPCPLSSPAAEPQPQRCTEKARERREMGLRKRLVWIRQMFMRTMNQALDSERLIPKKY